MKHSSNLITDINSAREWTLPVAVNDQKAQREYKRALTALKNTGIYNLAELIFYSDDPQKLPSLSVVNGITPKSITLLNAVFNEHNAEIGSYHNTPLMTKYLEIKSVYPNLKKYFDAEAKPGNLNAQTWETIQSKKERLDDLLKSILDPIISRPAPSQAQRESAQWAPS